MLVFVLVCIILVLSSFAIILKRKRKLVALLFAIIVLQMYCYYKCYVTLPRGAEG